MVAGQAPPGLGDREALRLDISAAANSTCGAPGRSASPEARPGRPRPGAHRGQLTVLATTGIDALDGYFARYLPQLFLAVIVPVAVIAVVAGADWVSAVLIAVSLPLIPIFMALVGATTRARTDQPARMHSLQRLAGHFLDVVAGAAPR